MTVTVGVAIASYNGIRYLAEQLESILHQKVRPDVISVSDDGSQDGTYEYLQAFRRRSSIRVVVNVNSRRLGVIENFMAAFRQCDTDYIAYCDQDDVWHEDKIAVCREVLSRGGTSLVFHRSAIVDHDLKSLGRTAPHNLRPGLYGFPHFPDYLWGFGHQMIFSREVLSVMTKIKESSAAPLAHLGTCFDRSLLVAAGMVGDIYLVDRELMKFRRHDTSVSKAGKIGGDANGGKSADPRRSRVEESLTLIDSILSGISCGTFRPSPDAALTDAYVGHLDALQKRYRRRKAVYESPSRLQRAGALMDLLRSDTYGSMRRNRLPARQLLWDCWRSAWRHP